MRDCQGGCVRPVKQRMAQFGCMALCALIGPASQYLKKRSDLAQAAAAVDEDAVAPIIIVLEIVGGVAQHPHDIVHEFIAFLAAQHEKAEQMA